MVAGPVYFFLWTLLRPEIVRLCLPARANQEVLAPGAAFQPRTYPKVDILNVILDGEAEYRDSEGNHVQASAGEVLLLSTQPGVSYSEHNLSKDKSLTRMQLWLDACPQRENPLIQKLALNMSKQQLIASPEGGMGSLQLRQQVWLHHIVLDKGESANFQVAWATRVFAIDSREISCAYAS